MAAVYAFMIRRTANRVYRSPGRFLERAAGVVIILLGISGFAFSEDAAELVMAGILVVLGLWYVVDSWMAPLVVKDQRVRFRSPIFYTAVRWDEIDRFEVARSMRAHWVNVHLRSGRVLKCRKLASYPSRRTSPAEQWTAQLNTMLADRISSG